MRSLQLESFWSRLPAFRVVAEHESLPAASERLRLSPSAISRSIQLLEKDLGSPLFSRVGGRLQLTAGGRRFLETVRRSMRLVNGVAVLRGDAHAAAFRLAVPGVLTAAVGLELVRRARAEHPDWTFQLAGRSDARDVASGVIDVAVVVTPRLRNDDVEAHPLGELALAVYCGPTHPLWGRTDAACAEVLSHPFIVAEDEVLSAAWPPDWRAPVCLELGSAEGALSACIASLGLALLPRAVAAAPVAAGMLRPLSAVTAPPLRLHALRRPRLTSDRAQLVIERLSSVVRELG